MTAQSRAGRVRISMVAGFLFAVGSAMAYEEPTYTVLDTDGDIEYRQYDAYLVSETVIETSVSAKKAGNEGFRRLFKYITGANKSQSNIAMTTPVQQSAGEKIDMTTPVQQGKSVAGWQVSFMLPANYTLDTAPVPTDSRVYVREVPGRLMAVLQFSGRWTEKNYNRRQAELIESLDAAGISALGEMQRAVYNSPFSLPFLRRNEVMVEVDRPPQ